MRIWYFIRSFLIAENSGNWRFTKLIYFKVFIFVMGILLFIEFLIKFLNDEQLMIEFINQEFFAFLLFLLLAIFLLFGYPVAITLAGTAIIVGCLGFLMDLFPMVLISVLPNRIFGIVTNETLIAVPLFIFMGLMLEKSGIANELLENMSKIWGRKKAD